MCREPCEQRRRHLALPPLGEADSVPVDELRPGPVAKGDHEGATAVLELKARLVEPDVLPLAGARVRLFERHRGSKLCANEVQELLLSRGRRHALTVGDVCLPSSGNSAPPHRRRCTTRDRHTGGGPWARAARGRQGGAPAPTSAIGTVSGARRSLDLPLDKLRRGSVGRPIRDWHASLWRYLGDAQRLLGDVGLHNPKIATLPSRALEKRAVQGGWLSGNDLGFLSDFIKVNNLRSTA